MSKESSSLCCPSCPCRVDVSTHHHGVIKDRNSRPKIGKLTKREERELSLLLLSKKGVRTRAHVVRDEELVSTHLMHTMACMYVTVCLQYVGMYVNYVCRHIAPRVASLHKLQPL